MAEQGRPTKYEGNKTIEKTRQYISECVDDFSTHTVRLPKAEGLAYYLGVSRDTLYEWAKKHKSFSDILEEINQIQSSRVIDNALAGNYNANIAKLLLGKHGYKEQSETDLTSKGEKIEGFNYIIPK